MALLEVVLGRPDEGPDRRRAARQSDKLVDVVLEELVVEEVRSGVLKDGVRQRVGEEQGRRIERREESGVDRYDFSKHTQDLDSQLARVEAGVAKPDDLASGAFFDQAARHPARSIGRDRQAV